MNLPHVGAAFRAKVTRFKTLVASGIIAEMSRTVVFEAAGRDRRFVKDWISVETDKDGFLIVKYPEWME